VGKWAENFKIPQKPLKMAILGPKTPIFAQKIRYSEDF
jgi:hypothetical protein